jgi:hypothetical protein
VPEEIVAQDQWGEVVFYDEWNSLELKWLPATADATDADVKATMEVFAQEARQSPSAHPHRRHPRVPPHVG